MLSFFSRSFRFTRRGGFTLLELQVAIILLAFGVVTLASLLATQGRLGKRVRGDFKPGATVSLTQSNDPWVRKLTAAARVSKGPIVHPAAPTAWVKNDFDVVAKEHDLTRQGGTVRVDLTTPVN